MGRFKNKPCYSRFGEHANNNNNIKENPFAKIGI
jgi:hypothetical protein